MNEENIQKIFDELATKANSEDAVTKAEVQTLTTELASLRAEQAEANAKLDAQAELLARKSSTKAQTTDNSADEEYLNAVAFVKGRHAIDRGEIKATEFSRLVPEEGGNTIPTSFDSEVTRGLSKQSPIRRLSRVIRTKGNLERIIKLRTSGAAATKSEKDAYNQNTTDTFAKLKWNSQDIVDQQRHTAWIDDNESVLALAQELVDSMVLNIAEKESDVFLNSTSTNSVDDVAGVTSTKVGLLAQTTLSSGVNKFTDQFGKLAVVHAAMPTDDSAYLSDAILALRSTLHSNYLSGAVLVFSSDVELALFMEKDKNGRAVMRPGDASVAGEFAGTVHGIPYVIDDMMPTVADAVANVKPAVLLADFKKAYTIAEYNSMKWVVDPITEPQFVKYTARHRIGAAVVDYKAIRALIIDAAE